MQFCLIAKKNYVRNAWVSCQSICVQDNFPNNEEVWRNFFMSIFRVKCALTWFVLLFQNNNSVFGQIHLLNVSLKTSLFFICIQWNLLRFHWIQMKNKQAWKLVIDPHCFLTMNWRVGQNKWSNHWWSPQAGRPLIIINLGPSFWTWNYPKITKYKAWPPLSVRTTS